MNKHFNYRHHEASSYAHRVAAAVAISSLCSVIIIAMILLASSHASVSKRAHHYQRDDGQSMRVTDPWRPLPGCLFLQSAYGKVLWPLDGKNTYNSAMSKLCGQQSLLFPDGAISPALGALLISANNQWRAPLQADTAIPMNKVQHGDMEIPQGAHIELTLDAKLQKSTQVMADCMTGRASGCAAVGLADTNWAQNSEGAAARMLGVVVLDIKSGAIEALASSHSACYQAEHAGLALPAHCPSPALTREHPQAGMLDLHALSGAKPGSLVKPIMAVAFMRDPVLGPKLRQQGSAERNALLNDIKNSDSSNFLDRVYCRDLAFINCARLQRVAESANDLGWNANSNNLFALAELPADKPSVRQVMPHFMQSLNRQGQWSAMSLPYDTQQAARCAIKNRWEKCQGEVANSASELIGQGNALASPLSIADMFKGIASAADGRHAELPAHLLQAVHGQLQGKASTLLPDLKPRELRVSQKEASLILEGMSLTHRGGTASSACLKAYGNGAAAGEACQRLAGVAGKTGTPGFSDEMYTWQKRTQVCHQIQQQLASTEVSGEQRRRLNQERARCVQSPIKWYAAVLRDNPASGKGAWSKVIVVLAERNYRKDGWIDSKGDIGSPNVAAELGFRLIKHWQGIP